MLNPIYDAHKDTDITCRDFPGGKKVSVCYRGKRFSAIVTSHMQAIKVSEDISDWKESLIPREVIIHIGKVKTRARSFVHRKRRETNDQYSCK